MPEGRSRACAVVLRETQAGPCVLMVKYRSFWTLPGGGVEQGESFAVAALRELLEETCLRGQVQRHLFTRTVPDGVEQGFLVDVSEDQQPNLGLDPELLDRAQELSAVAWMPLNDLKSDVQVALVLEALAR